MQHAYFEMKCVQCRRDPVFRVGSALTAERIFRLQMASVALEGVLLSGQLRQKLQQRIEPILLWWTLRSYGL